MAATASAVWEVRPTGNINNGGGYDASLAGVGSQDLSQQDVAQLVLTDGVCTGNTTLTSATGGFTAAMVGNALTLIFSGSFQGFFFITGFTNSNTVTLDTNGPNHTAMTITVGGASTISTVAYPFINTGPKAVAGNTIWVKGPGSASGDYVAITNDPTLSVAGTKHAPFTTIGYTTTRGDGGKPTILTAGTLDSLLVTANFNLVRNLHPLKTSGNFRCVNVSGAYCEFLDCIFEGGTPVRIAQGSNTFRRCEMKGSHNGNAGVLMVGVGNTTIEACEIHGNSGSGIDMGTAAITNVRHNNIYGNTLDGINFVAAQDAGAVIENNNIWNNARDNIRFDQTGTQGPFMNMNIRQNILGKAGGYDLNYTVADASALPGMSNWAATMLDCNAFLTTGTGRYHFIPANSGDLLLTTSPFGSDTDFTLNSTAGGGLSIRQNPCVSTLPSGNKVYSYIGASAPQTATVVTGQTQMRNMWREFTGELDATTPNADGGLGIPSTDTVDLYIWRGLEFLNRRIEYHYTTDLTTVALVAGTQEYTLPTDCIVIRWVEWNGIRLAKRDVDDWNREEKDWRQEPNGAPFEWAHEGTRIIFRYTPDAAAVAADSTVTVRYISTPPDFTASGPEQLLTEDYAVAVGCGVYLWSVAHPDSALAVQRAQGFKAMFDEEASGILEKYRSRSVSR